MQNIVLAIDWIDRPGLERDKAELQKEKAGNRALGVLIERNKAKAQKARARLQVQGMLEEKSPVMSPLSQMYEEACGILKRSESLEKQKLLQNWLDETLAFLHEIFDRWNGILVTKKQIRSAIADIRKADGVAGVTAASPSEGCGGAESPDVGGAHACTPA